RENNPEQELATPIVNRNFHGNSNTGNSPLDNSIAISNGGKIISVANNSIEFYSTSGSMLFTNSINGFFNDASITDVCDPVILYDSGADKFIFFAQECSGNSATSSLLVCFSQTNDPSGNWWRYKFSGDPDGAGTWFDYPKLAVSTNELYITGNSFSNDGHFQKALLFQIQKNGGFAGNNIDWQYWTDIDGDPFTLLPVSFGQQGNYGPGIYLVSTESTGSSSIQLYDLSDDLTASDEQLLHYTIPTVAYSPAGNAGQFGTNTLLDNGDCRTLSGFYLNGIIHFVFHSDYSNGYNGINYNRLDVTTQKNTNSTYGLEGYEYSYPAVASYASSPNDKSVMIGFGRTGDSIYPEVRVVNCDDGMNWSSSVLVREGEGYSDYTANPGKPERWGDYTGISRKNNNSNPTLWMSGMYGTPDNDWSTWIAEITGKETTATKEINARADQLLVYPNPSSQDFNTSFELTMDLHIRIDIHDEQGRIVKDLYDGEAQSGKNVFTFNTSSLAAGTYFISITSNQQILKNEKIILAN
ncbi:MAG: T9SS type A sorting domain-containing protein, partial [Saprospiraceae bacterium]